jgi:hypothetical protein|tara:strand:- start:70 stop:924 length:855 start_codon:yes stop_codon:yes gene_type:complete
MYYPKSQIKTDLYTNGKKFITSRDGNEYQGYYFSTSDNQYFTGKNPNDKPNIALELSFSSTPDPSSESNILTSRKDSYYNYPPAYNLVKTGNAININIPPTTPKQSIVQPTEEEYKVTEYQRYFVKKANEILYIEITQEEYNRYTNQDTNVSYQLYTPFTIPWLIVGNRSQVFQINKNTVSRISNNLKLTGFPSYFKNRYDQYFRYTKEENLTTNGTEFLNERTGKRYVGLYHIHPNKGPMVGAEHTTQIHDYLIPVSGSNIDYKVNKMETQNSQNKTIKSVGY